MPFLGNFLSLLSRSSSWQTAAHQRFRIAPVVDGEPRVETEFRAVDPQQACADAMKRAAPHIAADVLLPEHVAHSLQHLGGRAAGERQEQQAVRRNALRDQVGHAMHQRRRLARAGSGDDQQRLVAVQGRGSLRSVQRSQDARSDCPLAADVAARSTVNATWRSRRAGRGSVGGRARLPGRAGVPGRSTEACARCQFGHVAAGTAALGGGAGPSCAVCAAGLRRRARVGYWCGSRLSSTSSRSRVSSSKRVSGSGVAGRKHVAVR